MASLLLYAVSNEFLDRTLSDIADTVPASLLDEIIVVDDSGLGLVPEDKQYKLLRTTGRVGRATAWNMAAEVASGQDLVCMRQWSKLADDWLLELLEQAEAKSIVGSVVYDLDPANWCMLPAVRRRFGWRWDLSIYAKSTVSAPDFSPTVGECFTINKKYLKSLGGFDAGLRLGDGEALDLSLRAWMTGGSVKVADRSVVGVASELDKPYHTRTNLTRIAERWFGRYVRYYYDMSGAERTDVGKLGKLPALTTDLAGFINSRQPELVRLYDLRGTAADKSVAIVGAGPSLDLLHPSIFGRYDIVIGADYGAVLARCDYAIAIDFNIIKSLLSIYEGSKLLIPATIVGTTGGRICDAAELHADAIPFELAPRSELPPSVHPPFCNFDSAVPCALQLALFMQAAEITLLGCDNKFLGERSHSSRLTLADGGKYFPDNEITAKKFQYDEYALVALSKLARELGVPVLRISHV